MMRWLVIFAVGVALFAAGRMIPRAPEASPTAVRAAGDPSALAPAPGSSAARRAEIRTLLARLATVPLAAPPTPIPLELIERSITEPAEATQKRRARHVAEIDEKAPGLSAEKRAIVIAEADRLAWDKRQFRAAFLAGKLTEAEYMTALKDDIRATLSSYDEVLTDDEYVALFNRTRGADPFALESLANHSVINETAPPPLVAAPK